MTQVLGVRRVLDAIMPLLEPTAAARDDSRARPVMYDPATALPTYVGEVGVLYGWPRRERFDPEGTGELDLERFSIRLAYAVDAELEVAAGERSAETSAALFDRAEAIAFWIREHRRHDGADGEPDWEQASVVAVDYESLVTNSARGIYIDVDGYTLRTT